MTIPARPTATVARTVACLMAVVLVATACGGGDDSADTTAPATTTTTTAAPTTTAATTTTTSTTSTTTTTTKAPKPKPKPKPTYPLTGLRRTDKAIAAQPALVVKIDNAPGARPQTGFNAADIVYEEIVNDSLTRFAMVFHSQGSDPVGPIRSGRIQDIDLFGAYHGPLFAWSGGNATVTAAIRASDLVEIGPNVAYPAYFRSGNRSAPHNLYSNTSALRGYTPLGAGPPPAQFRYRDRGERVQGEPADGAIVKLDSIDVEWRWDPASELYLRTMEGSPHVDAASGQVSTNNVVVLVMNYATGISGSPDALSLGNGEAYVFTKGKWIAGTWSRRDRTRPFILRDNKSRLIELTPGRTFIELPRPGFTLPILPPEG